MEETERCPPPVKQMPELGQSQEACRSTFWQANAMTSIFTDKPTIQGKRVRLRPIRAQDAIVVHRLLQDAETLTLTGTVRTGNEVTLPWTVDELRTTYEVWSSADDRLVLAVIEQATDEMVGEVVLRKAPSEPD